MAVTVTFAGSGDAFGSGARFQACIHLRGPGPEPDPVLLDCGATSLTALRRCGLDPGEVGAVFVSHLHGDHFGGLPFLILDQQFAHRTRPLLIAGPEGTSARLTETMECLFPGSSQVRRGFEVVVAELPADGQPTIVAGAAVTAYPARHPSGAPALILRLETAGRVIGYTGDTAWTDQIVTAAAGADLLIAEAYYRDKSIPHHLSRRDITEHEAELTAKRIVLTHMSGDMLGSPDGRQAHDGLVIQL